MKRFGVSLAVCFVIWRTVAHAQTATVTMYGAGSRSCGQFIASIGKHPPGMETKMPTLDELFISENGEYQQWLLGFVSGVNLTQEKQLKGLDLAEIDLWMRNWCNKNPTQKVFDGAVAFILEMTGNAAAGQR
jgi:hypothetical protein